MIGQTKTHHQTVRRKKAPRDNRSQNAFTKCGNRRETGDNFWEKIKINRKIAMLLSQRMSSLPDNGQKMNILKQLPPTRKCSQKKAKSLDNQQMTTSSCTRLLSSLYIVSQYKRPLLDDLSTVTSLMYMDIISARPGDKYSSKSSHLGPLARRRTPRLSRGKT